MFGCTVLSGHQLRCDRNTKETVRTDDGNSGRGREGFEVGDDTYKYKFFSSDVRSGCDSIDRASTYCM